MCQRLPWRQATALVEVALQFSCSSQQETKVWRWRFDGPWGELWVILHTNKVTMIWNKDGSISLNLLTPPPIPFTLHCLKNRNDKSTSQGSTSWIQHVVFIITQQHVHSCVQWHFYSPSNSMTSILSPSTSCPTNWRPLFSKWCFSSGFT